MNFNVKTYETHFHDGNALANYELSPMSFMFLVAFSSAPCLIEKLVVVFSVSFALILALSTRGRKFGENLYGLSTRGRSCELSCVEPLPLP